MRPADWIMVLLGLAFLAVLVLTFAKRPHLSSAWYEGKTTVTMLSPGAPQVVLSDTPYATFEGCKRHADADQAALDAARAGAVPAATMVQYACKQKIEYLWSR